MPLAEFVRRLRPEARGAFLSLRALVVSLGAEVGEIVRRDGVEYRRRERTFLLVDVQRSRLLAIFPPDIPLPDPNGRLLRRGEKRYVALERADDVDGHVQEFVRRAYLLAEG